MDADNHDDDAADKASAESSSPDQLIPNPAERMPPGVEEIISRGGFYIGKLNEDLVLKYASEANDPIHLTSIKIESRLIQLLGRHRHIIESRGLAEDGLLLKYYPKGDLYKHLAAHPFVCMDQRLEWCKQLVDTVGYMHSKRIIHCDITLANILLDENHNIILADFQGLLVSDYGRVMLDGMSREPPKSYMPRENSLHADVHTDLFAVGSAIYHVINGHEVFPELRSRGDEKQISRRFKLKVFPSDDYVASHIVERCWRGQYSCAAEISADIAEVQVVSRAVEEAQKD